jgi:hypothetical protein
MVSRSYLFFVYILSLRHNKGGPKDIDVLSLYTPAFNRDLEKKSRRTELENLHIGVSRTYNTRAFY